MKTLRNFCKPKQCGESKHSFVNLWNVKYFENLENLKIVHGHRGRLKSRNDWGGRCKIGIWKERLRRAITFYELRTEYGEAFVGEAKGESEGSRHQTSVVDVIARKYEGSTDQLNRVSECIEV